MKYKNELLIFAYIYIFFLLDISFVKCLIKHDIIFIDNIKIYGKAKAEVKIVEIVMGHSYRNCDEVPGYWLWECDFAVFGKLCFFKETVSPYDIERYKSFEDPSYKLDFDGNAHDTYRDYLICSAVESVNLADNKNEHKNLFLDLVSYSGFCTMDLHITTVVTERTFKDRFVDWGRFKYFPFSNAVFSDYMDKEGERRKQVYHRIYTMSATMTEIYAYNAWCIDGYQGRDCWYMCQNTNKMTCACDKKPFIISESCKLSCQPGWLTYYASYRLRSYRDTIPYCDHRDLCYENKVCHYPSICLGVNNNTFYCENVGVYFVSILQPKGLHSDVWFLDEVIEVRINKSLVKNFIVLVNSTLWLYREELERAITAEPEPYKFLVSGLIFNQSFILNMEYIFNDWYNKKLQFTKKFVIHVQPKKVQIYQDGIQELTYYIYLNEILDCNSSAAPNFKSVMYWYCDSCYYNFSFQSYFLIDFRSKFEYTKIMCISVLLPYGRPNNYGYFSKEVFIKPFKSFQWSTTKNMFRRDEVIFCQCEAYITFELKIFQIEGYSTVPVIDNQLILQNIVGTFYKFLCILSTSLMSTFAKLLYFELLAHPTYVCFFFYPNVQGSIVQCGHDGNIPDEYTIDVSFYEYRETSYVYKSSQSDYYRLSYERMTSSYKVICTVLFLNASDFNKTKEIVNVLSYKKRETYYLTISNINCSRTAPYVEELEIEEFTTKGIVISHKLFFLNISYDGIVVVIAILIGFFGCAICMILTSFTYVGSFYGRAKSAIFQNSVIFKMRRNMCSLLLHDRINKQARHMIEQHNNVHVFSNKLSFKNNSLVRKFITDPVLDTL